MSFTTYGQSTPTGIQHVGGGIRTELGSVIPTAGNIVAYVDSNGVQANRPPDINSRTVSTLNAALAYCRSGQGDIVVVMPGHSESISSADQMSNLVAGTRIVGLGHGTNRPTFTWTVATATFLFDVANVILEGCILNLCSTANAGVTVAAPITVSAAGCAIMDCYIDFGGDANDIVTIGITVSSTDFVFARNRCFGATAAECTTFLRLTAAHRAQILHNYISGATSSTTVGLIQALTTASTNLLIVGNYVAHNKTASTEAITLMNSCTGLLEDNRLAVLDNLSVALDNDGDCTYGPANTLANTVGERGLVLGTVSA